MNFIYSVHLKLFFFSQGLKQMCIEQARPDPEKAAKTQELHRRLRVWLSFLVWIVEYKKTNKRKKNCVILSSETSAVMHTCILHIVCSMKIT